MHLKKKVKRCLNPIHSGLTVWNDMYIPIEALLVPRLSQRQHSHEPAILQSSQKISHLYFLMMDRLNETKGVATHTF